MPQQQTKSFTVNLFPLSTVDLETVDEWLLAVFEIKVKSYFQIGKAPLEPPEQLIYELAWRGMQLVNVFLQFTNIPAFYANKDIHFQRNKDHKISITFPVADIANINVNAYQIAIRTAFEILQWITNKEKTPEHTKQLYKLVETKARIPLKRFFTGGKSTLPLLKSAFEKNIPFIHLGSGIYQLGWGKYSRQLSRSTTETDSAIGARVAQDKAKSAVLLRMAGLPAPQHILVSSKKTALIAAKQLGWPLVVKPTNCDRGEGVTVGINNNALLLEAFNIARQFSKRQPIIIEREVTGVCHRLFINDGSLLYAIKRRPLSVIGDANRTVEQLILDTDEQEKNKAPWLISHRYLNDTLAVETMAARGFSLNSIPALNELVALRPFQSDVWGGTPEDVSTQVHPDNVTIAVKAAKIFGLYNAGIDIITPDISQPWHKNDAIINEVNFSPLFGGTEISKRYVPSFLDNFIEGNGRIPIDIFVGGKEAFEQARQRQKQLLLSGVLCVLTSHDSTIDLSENEMAMPYNSLRKRCLALLLDRQIEALVVVVQTNECLYQGLAFDQIDTVTKTGGELCSWKNMNVILPAQTNDAVNHVFEAIVSNKNA
jgi:cyanophycin synthetase